MLLLYIICILKSGNTTIIALSPQQHEDFHQNYASFLLRNCINVGCLHANITTWPVTWQGIWRSCGQWLHKQQLASFGDLVCIQRQWSRRTCTPRARWLQLETQDQLMGHHSFLMHHEMGPKEEEFWCV